MNLILKFGHIALISLMSTFSLSQSSPDLLLDFLKGQEQEFVPPPPKDSQAIMLGQLLRKFLEDNFRQIYYELYLMNGTLSNINSTLSEINLDSNLESNFTDFKMTMSNITKDIATVKDLITEIKEIEQTKSIGRLLRTSYSMAVRVAEMYQVSVKRRSCADLLNLGDKESGVHSIEPQRTNESSTIDVYCDMETDAGGWTVIQRRGIGNLSKDARADFNRNWIEYEQGFGNATAGDYWIGLESIRSLTRNCVHELLILDKFYIANKLDFYRLYVEDHSGNVDDSLLYHNRKPFSTFDVDNDDNRSHINPSCSKTYGGGWWFGDCLKSNLNGNYPDDGSGGRVEKQKGIRWNSWTGMKNSLKRTEMKIRPISNC